MPREICLHELRDRPDAVVAAVRAGERLTLTVDGDSVADVVPYGTHRSPWVPAAELRRIGGRNGTFGCSAISATSAQVWSTPTDEHEPALPLEERSGAAQQ